MSREQERRRRRRWRAPTKGADLTLIREAAGGWEFEECRLLDVSSRGVRFRTIAPVREGERRRLLMHSMEATSITATVEIHIRWVRDAELGSRDIGAEILTVNGAPLPNHSNNKESETMTNHLEQDRQMAARRLENLLGTEHWLGSFIGVLLSSYEQDRAMEFTTAEKLLATEKEEFERDLAIARKMLRLYPNLLEAKPAAESKPDSGAEPPQDQSHTAAT